LLVDDVFPLPLLLLMLLEFPDVLPEVVFELFEVEPVLVVIVVLVVVVVFVVLFTLTLTFVLSAAGAQAPPIAATAKIADKAKVFFIEI
jgi:hypothetical protein